MMDKEIEKVIQGSYVGGTFVDCHTKINHKFEW